MDEHATDAEVTPPSTRDLSRFLRVTLGLVSPDGISERRYARAARGSMAALGATMVGILAAFITVPLTITHLGPERYGAWMAILSILGWLSVADLGVANHLTNALSSAFGREDESAARQAVSTGLLVLSVGAAIVLLVGIPAWRLVPWAELFKVSPQAASDVRGAMLVALVLFCVGLPLAVVERMYVAFQRGGAANAWTAAGTAGAVLAIVVVTTTAAGLRELVLASMGATLVVKLANAVWLFSREHPELRPTLSVVTWRGAAAFLNAGAEFFVVQVAALVLFSTDNIVIAAVLGADRVAPYSVTFTLFTVSTMAVKLAFPYLWSAYAEALARGEGAWVVRTFKRTVVAGTAAAAVALVPLTLFGRDLIGWWAGPAAVPTPAVVGWMAAWNLVLAPATCISCFLNATGRTRIQAWAGLLVAPANIGMSILLAKRHGIAGVIAATVISYVGLALLPTAVAAIREARRVGAAARPATRLNG